MLDPQKIHRVARWIHKRGVRKVPALLQRINYFLTGCDLPAQVQVGQRVRFMHHGAGVVIHCQAVIGNDVMIHPHVVVGQNVRQGVAVPLQQIVIGNRVQLGAGAKIIASGFLEIGDGATVGANAVVLHSVPPNCTAVGVPARILPPKVAAP